MIETPAEIIAHVTSPEAASSFVAWRKRVKKPLTEAAALRIIKTLAAIKAAGGDPDDALAMAEEHGWQTIKADWYFKMLKQEVTPAMPQPKKDDRLTIWAEAIRSGKDYLCRNIPSTGARELVQQGIVTHDQCKRAGVAI
jgi:hypothetical protein